VFIPYKLFQNVSNCRFTKPKMLRWKVCIRNKKQLFSLLSIPFKSVDRYYDTSILNEFQHGTMCLVNERWQFDWLLELSPATKRETHHATIVTVITIVSAFMLCERLCEQWSVSESSFIPRMSPHGCRMTGTKWMPAHRWSLCRLSSPERYPRALRMSLIRYNLIIWEELHTLQTQSTFKCLFSIATVTIFSLKKIKDKFENFRPLFLCF